jgi:hypothetical protein
VATNLRWIALLLVCTGLVWGCAKADRGPDSRFAAQRAKYLLTSEPSGALPVLDAREELACDGSVTLVGMVGGAPAPLSKSQASFVVADPTLLADDGHDHHECGDDCPFCKRKHESQAQGLALVEIVDEQGVVVPIGAEALFGLAPETTVVVHGQAQIDSQGNLVVKAQGLYIRR